MAAPSATSSAPPTTTSFSDSPNSNATNGAGNGPGLQSSASLYLYTFLATLVLLLGVSAAIVVRSLIMRRRHRHMIEEAIRNGTWVPPSPRRGKIDPADKPQMFEVFAGTSKGKSYAAEDGDEKDWETITNHPQPFSVTYIKPPSTSHSLNSNNSSLPRTPIPSRAPSLWRRALVSAPSAGSTTAIPIVPGTSSPSGSLAFESTNDDHPTMRVSVLVAMPHPPLYHDRDEDEDGEVPIVEFGITEVPVVDAHRRGFEVGSAVGKEIT